jgi:hypothetical protein
MIEALLKHSKKLKIKNKDMKKAKHKYKLGETVKFKFFDGSVHIGQIASLNYMGEDWDHTETNYSIPQYTIHVPSDKYSRGYMIYSSMTNNRIFDKDTKLVKPKFELSPNQLKNLKNINNSQKELLCKQTKNTNSDSELDDAIAKQKKFISGKVNK